MSETNANQQVSEAQQQLYQQTLAEILERLAHLKKQSQALETLVRKAQYTYKPSGHYLEVNRFLRDINERFQWAILNFPEIPDIDILQLVEERRKEAAELIAQADQLWGNGDKAAASALYDEAVELQPSLLLRLVISNDEKSS